MTDEKKWGDMEHGLTWSLGIGVAAGPGPGGAGPSPVVLVFPPERSIGQGLELARVAAEASGTGIVVLRPVIFPRQTPLDPESPELRPHRSAVKAVVDEALDLGLTAEGVVRLGHQLGHTVADAAGEHGASVVLVPGRPPVGSMGGFTPGEVDKLMESTRAPVVVYGEPPVQETPGRVAVAASGGPHTPAVAAWAGLVSRAWGIPVDLFHVLEPDGGEEARAEAASMLEDLTDAIVTTERVTMRVLEAGDVTQAVLHACESGDALVLGAPTRSRWRHLFYGSTARRAQRASPGWSFVVHGPQDSG